MTLEAVKHINTILQLPAIKALFSDGANWLLAEDNAIPPFVTFRLMNEGSASKNGISQYRVNIIVTGKSLTQSATLADGVENAIDEDPNNKLRFRGNEIQYNDSEAREASCVITYEFKY